MRLLSCIGIVCAFVLGIIPEARAGNVFGTESVFGWAPSLFLALSSFSRPGRARKPAGGSWRHDGRGSSACAQAAPIQPPAGVPYAPGPDAGCTDPGPPGRSSGCPSGQDQSEAGSGSGKEDRAGE